MVRDWVRMRFGSGMGRADVRDGEGRQTSRYISSHTLGVAVSAGASASMHDSTQYWISAQLHGGQTANYPPRRSVHVADN